VIEEQGSQRERDEDDELARKVLTLPREIGAPRELWSGIGARIEAKRRRVVVLRRTMTAGAMFLAAAAVLIAIRSPEGPVTMGPTPPPATSQTVAVAPTPPATSEPGSAETLFPEEAAYVAALSALETTLHDRENDLPPKDAARVEGSLRAIDVAIQTTRASLADHPGDADLRAELDAEYEQKIDAMNDVLEWTTRS
jgi:hypothetical protein